MIINYISFVVLPHPVTPITSSVAVLVGHPYKPSLQYCKWDGKHPDISSHIILQYYSNQMYMKVKKSGVFVILPEQTGKVEQF